ncbi:MAG: bi-domain-containing oxidoreductase [Myxococcota bacterium]
MSAGTEKMLLELGRKSLVGKARARPDMVRRILQKAKQEGLKKTWEQVSQRLDAPVPLGYASAGVVQDVQDAPGLSPGMRVACAGMGYASHAELNWVPRNLIAPVPDGISLDEACSATVGAIALQGVRLAAPRLGDRIVVIGLGLIGNLCAQLCRASGARVFGVDLAQDKVDLALATGCHNGTSDSESLIEQVLAFTGGNGADAVVIAASAQGNDGPMRSAVEMCRLRGKIVAVGNVGMGVPRDDAYKKELTITASMSYGPGRYDARYEERGEDYPFAYVRYTEQRNMIAYMDAVEDGVVDVKTLLTHRFAIDDALSAYDLITRNTEPYVGVLLTYGQTDDPELARPTQPRPAPTSAANSAGFDSVRGKVGIGVVGAGMHTRAQLLPALKGLGVAPIGVVNRTGASAEQAKEIGGFEWAGTEFQQLLDDSRIDAIIVGTRHRLHADQVIAAFKAGKHVFVEKPLCLTGEELTRIAESQAEHRRYVQVGANRRFSPYTTALLDEFAIRADPISINVRINAGAIPAEHWLRDPAEGGGRLVGEGVHWIDWCQAVVGRPIQSVVAQVSPGGPTALAADTWTATMTFSDGSMAQVQYAAEGARTAPKERLEVIGLGKLAVIDDWTSGTLFHPGGSRKLKAPRGQQKGIVEQLAAFVRALNTGTAAVPLDTTWHVQHAVLTLNQTSMTGVAAEVAWPRPA